MSIIFPERRLVERLHDVQIQRFGGAAGLRDENAFESALARPVNKAFYGCEDIFELAAAYLYGLAKNHAFVDGNKRIAFAAADVFLRINGWRLRRVPMQIYAEMMQMFESGTFDIAHLDPWLRSFAVAAE